MTTATQTSTQTSTGTVGTIRSTTGVRIAGLPAEVLDIVRSGGMDASGNPPVRVVAEGGEPVRCCLRDAREGEELVLFGYAPRLPASPYRETGAVFAHARTCPAPPAPGYPREWLGRPQVLRAYDARGWIHPATRTHDGTDPEGALAQVLAEPGVVQVHSRNVAYGCWMFTAAPA
jgi:hypothetical protein